MQPSSSVLTSEKMFVFVRSLFSCLKESPPSSLVNMQETPAMRLPDIKTSEGHMTEDVLTYSESGAGSRRCLMV